LNELAALSPPPRKVETVASVSFRGRKLAEDFWMPMRRTAASSLIFLVMAAASLLEFLSNDVKVWMVGLLLS